MTHTIPGPNIWLLFTLTWNDRYSILQSITSQTTGFSVHSPDTTHGLWIGRSLTGTVFRQQFYFRPFKYKVALCHLNISRWTPTQLLNNDISSLLFSQAFDMTVFRDFSTTCQICRCRREGILSNAVVLSVTSHQFQLKEDTTSGWVVLSESLHLCLFWSHNQLVSERGSLPLFWVKHAYVTHFIYRHNQTVYISTLFMNTMYKR